MTALPGAINPHLLDQNVRPFTSSTFSPIDYLNSTLPSSLSAKQQQGPSLSTIASQTQSHISTLNAQTTRLSTTLTSLTDDILRTSSRLAYEVELLRGEALSLADSLSSRGDLHNSIVQFVPDGLDSSLQSFQDTPLSNGAQDNSHAQNPEQRQAADPQETPENNTALEPEALPRLRTLLHVRAQLQSVIQQFNLALSFPFPPSLLATTASSLISVNPPNPDPTIEKKGQAALARIRQEVSDLLVDAEGRGGGVERAIDRVQSLREICMIWKGTSEEKARLKWVDGLEQMIEDEVRKKEDGRQKAGLARQRSRKENSAAKIPGDAGTSGSGFLSRLRGEIYME